MKIRKLKRKTLMKYSAITIVSVAGFALYTNDHSAPELESFYFQQGPIEGEYELGGRITDERGVSYAEFECFEGTELKQVIVVAMSGANRNKVSFGVLSRSPNWVGSWKGTSYDLTFSAILRNQPVSQNCRWSATLKDNLGNQTQLAVETN